jgi:hypothetical protein
MLRTFSSSGLAAGAGAAATGAAAGAAAGASSFLPQAAKTSADSAKAPDDFVHFMKLTPSEKKSEID